MTVAAAELFAPELTLGLRALDDDLRARLGRYLLEVMAARGFPLHVAVAWNALHFGFDPVVGSYSAELLSADMPSVALGARCPAVPVGALAWVQVGGAEGAVWAEVVGKDGRPDGIGVDGVAPAAISGAPAAASDRSAAVVTEALVVDFAAFGTIGGLDRRLERLRLRGQLDRHGLVLVEAEYEPASAADDEDLWFYARWLFDCQRHLLRNGPLAASLANPDDDDALRNALVASITTVSELLASLPGSVRWGDYVMPAAWVEAIDDSPNLPLHACDLDYLLVSLARTRPRQVNFSALAPRLDELAGVDAYPDRPDAAPADPLAGAGYLRMVAATSRWLANRLTERGGLVCTTGGSWSLRVDDIWPWGGLWRAEAAVAGHPLLEVAPDVALGLGAAGNWGPLAAELGVSTDEIEERVAAAWRTAEANQQTADDELARDTQAGEEDQEPGTEDDADDSLDPTLISATTALRRVDIDNGSLPLDERFAWLADGALVALVLYHVGDLDDDQRNQNLKADVAGRLAGASWPLDFFSGIRLHLDAFAGGRTLFAATQPLDQPVTVDGFEYCFAFDAAVVGRMDTAVEVTLTAIAVAALARHGRQASDGTRRASAREVSSFCYGPGQPDVMIRAVAAALDVAVGSGRIAMAGTEYAWSAWREARPARRSAPLGWDTRPVALDAVRVHWVPGFVRYLPAGWQASDTKVISYRQARAEGKVLGPPELPAGATWVEGHQRGNAESAWTAALRDVMSSVTGRPPRGDEMAELFSGD